MISKSSFKIFLDCPQKLKYKRNRYESSLTDNEYLAFFAECGFMVEALARALYPSGEVPEPLSSEDEVEATRRYLNRDRCVLFEPTFKAGGYMSRIDILERVGGNLMLIEIKAKSFNPDEDQDLCSRNGEIRSEWSEYIYDVAFQTMVVREATGLSVTPFLLLVDVSKTSSEEAVYSKIQFAEIEDGASYSTPRTTYVGNADLLKDDHLLHLLDVSRYVDDVMADVVARAQFAVLCDTGEVEFPPPPLSPSCKACEYRSSNGSPDGFSECWGAGVSRNEHIVDLYFAGQLGGGGEFGRLVAQGARSIGDIPAAAVKLSSKRGQRQAMQIEAFATGREVWNQSIAAELSRVEFPLYFLDFETSRIPVPYHVGMNPYEQVPFQFSCHRLDSAMSPVLEHEEWINVDDVYPSRHFAASLRACLGERGSVVVWSPFEQSALRDIVRQNEKYRSIDGDLIAWVDGLHRPISEGGRILDLMKVCLDGYCHPKMGGSVSIKAVLRSIWETSHDTREHPWFRPYLQTSGDGTPLSPYEALPGVPDELKETHIGRSLDAVRDGVGAMRAYQQMLYGPNRDVAAFKAVARDLLLEYCKLDTLAMVMIWNYWTHHLPELTSSR